MLTIGCHLSAGKGFLNMAKEAVSIGANTFQFFTRNPRGSQAKPIDSKDIELFKSYAAEHHLKPILAHAPYTLNPAADKPETREFARIVLTDDLNRMEHLPGNMYNFHPGSHVGQGITDGINRIAELLNEVLTPNQTTTVLLEAMSGKGTEIGARFEELKEIMDQTHLSDKIGVCLDTCHIFAGGYDIAHNLDNTLNQFDKIIGLNKLKAIHLNDSLMPFNSRKDRHEKIGKGFIGLNSFAKIINHPALKDKPFYLETPQENLSGYAGEITLLKKLYQSEPNSDCGIV